MASAQVLKKKEHLEAGKKKLEEFRRKKAAEKAEKAKKATSASQQQVTDAAHEKQPSESEHVRLTDSNGIGTSDGLGEGRLEPSGIVASSAEESDNFLKSDSSASFNTNASPSIWASNNDVHSHVFEQSYLNNNEYKGVAVSAGLDGSKIVNDTFQSRKADDGPSAQSASAIGNDHFLSHHISSAQENHAPSHSSYTGLEIYASSNNDGSDRNLPFGNSGTSAVGIADIFPKKSGGTVPLDNSSHKTSTPTFSPYQESLQSTTNTTNSLFGLTQKFSAFSDNGEKKPSGDVAHIGSVNLSSPWTSEKKYSDYSSDAQRLSSHAPQSLPAAGGRSRPSFLDSIQISKDPSPSPSLFGSGKADSSSSKDYPMDGSVSQRSSNSFLASGDGAGLFNHVTEHKNDFLSHKQNEDFAALEQHIEDLTQDKFSLQRALEASRALAESLASENSTLTDSYNQQGSVVNQLKFDLETLQEEIKAQMVELEAVKIEYANAQMECSAADERAKLLASEVIGLEEKVLRLRSNELKLERQLENTQAEISSYRKKISSLEKDRQDLQSTIDALQEEKKLLQSKLRKASASSKSTEINKTSYPKKEVSTSTEDLDINSVPESFNSENLGSASLGDDAATSQLPQENIMLSLEALPSTFPPDQIRVIQNINTLMAELTLEKEQLMQALSAESSQSSKLLELNKELTRKLEAQTQRLELLTAQSMANDNIQPRPLDPRIVQETVTYADEGDEVVERVLGWIMKLFPGGPSRRRPSKHL